MLVGKEQPSVNIRNLINYYSEDLRFDNEFSYLKADIYNSNHSWLKKANISKAKCVIALSLSIFEGSNELETDKTIAMAVKRILNVHQNSRITLVLQSEFVKNVSRDSCFNGVNIIAARLLSEYILAQSLENKGFCTILTHLLTMKEKVLP